MPYSKVEMCLASINPYQLQYVAKKSHEFIYARMINWYSAPFFISYIWANP